ncbi:response regulator [Lichenicoccus roseus]|uniref:Response regulator n=1 Tax=Lichenicoccus roseus TaxID=2683649 RepID=A0A5R9J2X7_9PROT|nr:response regulator [Lichenicoccus roseus]TLU71902.1 response regulator [Lichenicoccus roseus]
MSKPPVRVLVAEDELFIRLLLVEALEEAGYDILKAKDGLEALQLIEHPDGVELVVSDINMPGASGLEVVRHLRQIHPDIPVILVSGRHEQLGGPPVPNPLRRFPKPFRLADVVKAVQEMLAERDEGDRGL